MFPSAAAAADPKKKSPCNLVQALDFSLKDTAAWLLASLPWGLVLNGESGYRQAVFAGRKGVPGSRVVGIETKVRAFRIQSYFRKIPLVSGPVGPDARGGVGHKPLGTHVFSTECGLIYFCPEIPQTLGVYNTFFRFFRGR